MEKLFYHSFMLFLAAVLIMCGFFAAGNASANVVSAALDGSASGFTSGSSMMINLTTTKPNDLLYVSINEPESKPVISVISDPILNWTNRKIVQYSTSNGLRQLETWYAVSPSSGLINININFCFIYFFNNII